jgi:8-oxo-dGTP pyrophosphatase MutT (NUDIX family)
VGFERIASEEVYEGQIFSVRKDRFRFDDGDEVEREIVSHPGAVGVVAHDGERIYLVRQPREAVDEQAVLEIPAGKLEQGEDPLETGKRELAEEIGKGAREWRHLKSYWSSVGFTDEEVHIYLATDLYDDDSAEATEEERIEIEAVPLDRLDDVIAECRDVKSLLGLLWLKVYGLD